MGALGTFLLLVLFGAAVGFAMIRYGHNWIGRQVAGAAVAGAGVDLEQSGHGIRLSQVHSCPNGKPSDLHVTNLNSSADG